MAVSCCAGVIDGGGVSDPFTMGDVLPLRFMAVTRGGTKLLWWICGLIGDLGATTRAPSGESGVRHCSLPERKKRENAVREKLVQIR